MQMKNRNITEVEHLKSYFDFEEIWEKRVEFRNMLNDYPVFREENPHIVSQLTMLLDYCAAALDGGETAQAASPDVQLAVQRHSEDMEGALNALLIKCLKADTRKCRTPAGVDFSGNSAGAVDIIRECAELEEAQDDDAEMHARRFCRENAAFISLVSDEAKVRISEASLSLAYLVLLIHFYANRSIEDCGEVFSLLEADFKRINAGYFERHFETGICMASEYVIQAPPREAYRLPYFRETDGGVPHGFPIRIVRIVNDCGEAVKLRLGSTALCRILEQGRAVYALRRKNGFAGFLPRFTVSDGDVFRADDKQIRISGSVEISELFERRPASWGYGDGCGLLVVNEAGEVESRWQRTDALQVSKDAAMVSAFQSVSCLLRQDGSVVSSIGAFETNQRCVCIRAGQNNAAAIRDDGRLVFARGKGPVQPGGRAALDVRVYNDRWICLDEQGGLHADVKLDVEEDLQALCIAIGYDGYAAAFADGIRIFSLHGVCIRQIPCDPVYEMEMHDKKLYLYTDAIRIMSITD